MNRVLLWLRADELATNENGWSFNLALFRIAFLGLAVLPWAIRNLGWIDHILPSLSADVWTPISFFQFIPSAVLSSVALAKALALLNLFCILCGLVGLCTRTSLAFSTVLSLYLFGLTENQGKIDHFHHLIWFMALLAAGPSGLRLSVDALWRGRRNPEVNFARRRYPRFDSLWTLRYVWILLGVLYLIPGLAKLEQTFTAGWASATNLQHVLWRKWLEVLLYAPHSGHPLRVDQSPPWMLELAGIGVILFETGFLFAILFRRLRPWLVLAGLAFHVGNGLVLQIWFTTLLPVYVALIDWDALWRWFRSGRAAAHRVGRMEAFATAAVTPRAIPRDPPGGGTDGARPLAPFLSPVHLVGIGLVACELFVSFTMFFYVELAGFTARLPRPLHQLIVDIGRARPEWPFAHYPTFSSPTGGEAEIWEAYWVSGGREWRVSSATYDSAFGNSGMIWNLVVDRRNDARVRSLDLARELWHAASPELRRSVTEVKVYRSDYRLQSPGPALETPVHETLLYTFPAGLIAQRTVE